MKKAILLLDEVPHCCEMCYLCRIRTKGRYCVITRKYDNNFGRVQKNCPLKPLPSKKEVKEIKHFEDIVNIETQYDLIENKIVGKIKYDTETIFNEGYNSCLDEILEGETE